MVQFAGVAYHDDLLIVMYAKRIRVPDTKCLRFRRSRIAFVSSIAIMQMKVHISLCVVQLSESHDYLVMLYFSSYELQQSVFLKDHLARFKITSCDNTLAFTFNLGDLD